MNGSRRWGNSSCIAAAPHDGMQRLVEGHAVGGASGACKRNHTQRQSFFTQRKH